MTKILTAALVALLLGALLFAFITFGKRTKTEQEEIIIIPQQKSQEIKVQEAPNPSEIPSKDITTDPEASQEVSIPSKKSAYHITKDDCNNECENFTENTVGWRYCANICGIIDAKAPGELCENKDGLSKDYCLKNKAITDNDPDSCSKISDKGISKQCQNQIIEGIVDGF